MSLYNVFQSLQTLAAIGLFPAGTRRIGFRYAGTAPLAVKVVFDFLIAERVAKTNDHLKTCN